MKTLQKTKGNLPATLSKLRKELDAITSPEDALKVCDRAALARDAFKLIGRSVEECNPLAEIYMRAHWRFGDFIKDVPHNVEGRTDTPLPGTKDQRRYARRFRASAVEADIQEYVRAATAELQQASIAGYLQARKEARGEEIAANRDALRLSLDSIPIADRWQIHHADMETWQTDKQFDWIITDPPYPKEFLPLYEVLALRAKEWLKDGGLLVAMCGQSYLDEIMTLMSRHLTYYWTAAYLTPGQPTPLRQVNVNTTWKPLLIFANGEYSGKIFGDVFRSEANDKDFHDWGQSLSGMTDIITKLALPGESILDPFCGAATTGLAALGHGCLFEGIEIDIERAELACGRLHEYA